MVLCSHVEAVHILQGRVLTSWQLRLLRKHWEAVVFWQLPSVDAAAVFVAVDVDAAVDANYSRAFDVVVVVAAAAAAADVAAAAVVAAAAAAAAAAVVVVVVVVVVAAAESNIVVDVEDKTNYNNQ